MKMTSPTRHLVLFLLAAAFFTVSGCGGESDSVDTEDLSGYHLDPPELAGGGFPPIEDGVPVFCYHYFRSGFDGVYLMKVLGSVLFGMPALGPREFWTTPVGEFEKHLRYFRDTNTVVMTLDEVADLLDTVPARFNRFVFYSGDIPHSACISDPGLLSSNPTEGRLTLNCFVSALPKT